MTINEFNEKYKHYLGEKHYGMSIGDERVIEYMDKEFEKEIAINPDFEYYQIKEKFNCPRVYTNTDNGSVWEKKISEILKGLR